jgi:fructose-bisphosphate aldolase class II
VTLVAMGELVEQARSHGRGIGAFNVVQLEHAEAVVDGAARAGLPVVLQLSENTADYHGGLAPLALAVLEIARAATVPAVVHLDHATRSDLVREAVALGVPSVMVDASTLSHDENVAVTADLTAWCHGRGVWVEAELGEIGGKDGAHAPGVRTDPEEAAAFVGATGVDALAVAVGSSHAMTTRDARLDDGLVARIAAHVEVPLVLHGSSGVPDDGLASAVRHGMVKVNVATHLNAVLTRAVREALAADEALVDPRRWLGPGREAVAAEVARLLRVLCPDPAARPPARQDGRGDRRPHR